MRHGRAHRKLGRTTAHRRSLLRNLVSSLFLSRSGRITTTVEKAKEARRIAEKMITLGKREGIHARRLAARFLPDRTVVKKLFDDIAPKFADRKGGYTRVLRVGPRPGDNADMALLELVGIADELRKVKAEKDEKKKGKAEKKEAEATDEAKAAEKAKRDEAKKAARRERAEKRGAARADEKSKAKSVAKSQTKGGKKGA